jgi:hypothetical protein
MLRSIVNSPVSSMRRIFLGYSLCVVHHALVQYRRQKDLGFSTWDCTIRHITSLVLETKMEAPRSTQA